MGCHGIICPATVTDYRECIWYDWKSFWDKKDFFKVRYVGLSGYCLENENETKYWLNQKASVNAVTMVAYYHWLAAQHKADEDPEMFLRHQST